MGQWAIATLIFLSPHGSQACDTRLRGRGSDVDADADDEAWGGVSKVMLAGESAAAMVTEGGGVMRPSP